ncbi:lipase [Legionella jamestowniensis]|uniref:Lipase n=1 Tax=Legionella jamestowniensis TaxID=455 RepID=A0ABX2XR58_9GAMM|nr:alpha/beta hydrolase [Legionella jamestowniensis]OCH97102.1 lipase [Legionella jamestowniensis]
MNTFTVTIPGFSIGGKAYGNPDLPPMLALHGWLDNANSFDLLAPYLEKHFHLLAIDLPGHGHSSHLPEGCYYHFSDGIFTTLEIINALQLRQVHLLGHSMGACLASLIAGVTPEKILSLVLIEGLGPFSKPEETCRDQMAQYITYTSRNEKNPKPYPSLMQAAQARAKRGYLSLEHAQILCQRGTREENGSIYWRHDRRLLTPTPLRMTEKQILSCLRNILAKTCLIWGQASSVFDDYDMDTRTNAVANLKTHRLPGGHHVHMEYPDAVARCLREFYNF